MKRLVTSVVFVGALLSGAALAQSPDEEWVAPPTSPQPVTSESAPLPPIAEPVPSPAPAYAPLSVRPEVLARVRPKQERNERSVWGAAPLGGGNRGQSVMMGFPLIDVRALFGLGDRVDVGLGFDSYFFMMNQPKAIVRVNLVRSETVALSAQLEGGYAFFVQRATLESRGARWLTGRRNVNINPSLVLSIQGPAPRAPRIFFAAHYLLALDFEGYASSPLGGIPPAVIFGHNGGIRGGAELPLSARTSFLFMFGLDIHGRDIDSVVMPSGGLGLVTSL